MSTPKSGSKAAKVQAHKSLAVAMWNMAIAYPEVAEEFRNLALSEAEEVESATAGKASKSKAKPTAGKASKGKAKKAKKTKGLLAEVVEIDGDAITLAIPKGWPVVQTASGRNWVNVPLTGAKRPIAVTDCNEPPTKSKVAINRKVYRKDNWTRPKSIAVGDTFPLGYLVVTKGDVGSNPTDSKGSSTSKKSKKAKKAEQEFTPAQNRHIGRHQLTMSTGRGPGTGGCTCGADSDANCLAVKQGWADKVWEIEV